MCVFLFNGLLKRYQKAGVAQLHVFIFSWSRNLLFLGLAPPPHAALQSESLVSMFDVSVCIGR